MDLSKRGKTVVKWRILTSSFLNLFIWDTEWGRWRHFRFKDLVLSVLRIPALVQFPIHLIFLGLPLSRFNR